MMNAIRSSRILNRNSIIVDSILIKSSSSLQYSIQQGRLISTLSAHPTSGTSVTISKEALELELRVKSFIKDKIIPLEKKENESGRRGHHGPTEELRNDLIKLAKEAGLVGNEHVHSVLKSHLARAVVFEAAGYSMLGPVAL